MPAGVDLGPHRVRPGDAIIVSGAIGMHGIAVMSVREGLEFGSEIVTDSAPLNGLVAALLESGADVHMMRDPTRGGVAATLNEIAHASRTGMVIVERDVPGARRRARRLRLPRPRPALRGQRGQAGGVRRAAPTPSSPSRRCGPTRIGAGATLIGTVVEEHPGVVVARTGIGGTRVVDLPLAEQLPASADRRLSGARFAADRANLKAGESAGGLHQDVDRNVVRAARCTRRRCRS